MQELREQFARSAISQIPSVRSSCVTINKPILEIFCYKEGYI